jgi:hypothetical protein
MHAINKTRNAKGMLKMWRIQPNSFLTRIGKSFAAQTREAILYSKRIEEKRRPLV